MDESKENLIDKIEELKEIVILSKKIHVLIQGQKVSVTIASFSSLLTQIFIDYENGQEIVDDFCKKLQEGYEHFKHEREG